MAGAVLGGVTVPFAPIGELEDEEEAERADPGAGVKTTGGGNGFVGEGGAPKGARADKSGELPGEGVPGGLESQSPGRA